MKRSRFSLKVLFLALMLAIYSLSLGAAPTLAHTSKEASGTGRGPGGALTAIGKARPFPIDVAAITAAKLSGKIHANARQSKLTSMASYAGSPPSYDYLNTSYADWILEPPSSGKDAKGYSYVDGLFGLFCGPGAATVSLDYWNNVNTRAIGLHAYSTPNTTTWWGDSNPGGLKDTAYMMYLATQVNPPSYVSPGMMTWAGNNTTTYLQDLVDAMNWESSNHSSTWQSNPFYLIVSNPTLSQLQADVTTDIYNNGIPPVVLVNDAYLPDWANSPYKGRGHYVSIIGYNNAAGTFTYEETCGPATCGTSSYGQHTISQQQLLNGILSYGGALVW
ncbi:hypothetical protein KSC_006430 [Ktedonobacter sp. SOSP1-52]|uniref:hypothetical protein n=1 Tax=Ktedonobacter sp. SOSP1-52 TaxID=2778366 RepID=UPI00191612FD|nr:hypothetical protein [Ktedonobacter sp. SOSP1-52]GHO61751.1 hypothetical protein KSC_006430 [Ktedonobacter sp. SOSP1-52]